MLLQILFYHSNVMSFCFPCSTADYLNFCPLLWLRSASTSTSFLFSQHQNLPITLPAPAPLFTLNLNLFFFSSPPPLVQVQRSAPSRPSCRWWRRIQTMTTQAHRRTFTISHRRGSAGSRTPNPTTVTRAGPSASLGDDPSLWRSPLSTYTPQPPPTHKQTLHQIL